MYYFIAVLITFILAILGDLYDISLTVKGIKLGVAVEGNEQIVWVAGTNKPTYWQLLWINMLLPPIPPDFSTWPILPIGIGGMILGWNPTALPFATALFLIGLKHYIAGRKWKFYIDGGKDDLSKGESAWQKFIRG